MNKVDVSGRFTASMGKERDQTTLLIAAWPERLLG